jgi:hypothetical protein
VKYTIKNVILEVMDFKADQKGIVTEKISGIGNDFVIGTY